MIQVKSPLSFLEQNRLQVISTTGLGILFSAAVAALGHDIVSPAGMAAACLPPLVAGVLIAATRRWIGMALVGVIGSLCALIVAGLNGAPGVLLSSGLAVLLAASTLLYWRRRWLWLQALVVGGALSLAIVWHVCGLLTPSMLGLALAGAWVVCAGTSIAQRAAGDDPGAALLGLGGSAAALLSVIVAAGFTAPVAGVAGALLCVLGLIHDQLPGGRQPTGPLLLVTGLSLGAAGATLWLGNLGLALGLGGLSVLLLVLGRRRESRALNIAAWIAAACQAAVLATAHPALHQAAPLSWHVWSAGALAVACQLLWIGRRRAGETAATRPRWITAAIGAALPLHVLAALSTELSLLVSWIPAMTLLWTAAAAALWVLGRRGVGLRAAALSCIGAALVKLTIFDWALLGGGARVTLLMIVGTTLLVTPLFSRAAAAGQVAAAPSE